MRFFENIKVKNAAKKLGFTLEEYDVFLSAQNIGISEADFRKWLSEFKDIISLNDYSEYLKVKDAGVNVQEFLDYRSNYQSQLSIEQFIEYKNHYKQYLNVEEYLEISKISAKMSVADKIEYFKKYSDKMSSEDYLRYKEALKLGFDLEHFLNYISLDEDISMQDYLSQQKLQKAGIASKDIKVYFTKYAHLLTVEQYIEFIALGPKVLTISEYQKYLTEYFEKLTVKEYVEYCKAKKYKYTDYMGKKASISETDAQTYAKNSDKIAFDKFIEYYECGYSDMGFYYLKDTALLAYITYISEGNEIVGDASKLSKDEWQKQLLKIDRYIVDFTRQYICDNSKIEAGVLKKYTGTELMLFCIPENVVEIADDAFKNSNINSADVLFHNQFKKFGESPDFHVSQFGVYLKDKQVLIYECLLEHRFPDTMEDISTYTLGYCDKKIKAPLSMKKCEALEDKEVEWFDPVSTDKIAEYNTQETFQLSESGTTQTSKPKGEKAVKDTKQVTSKIPKKTGNKKYEDIISKLEVSFPFETKVKISRNDVDRVNDRIESMQVGEQLVIRPNKPPKIYEWDVYTEVYDSNGLFLGTGGCGGTNKLYQLADVLTAEVLEVTPLSQRRKGCKYALLTIKVDCDFSGKTLTASLPKPEKKFTVKYDADGKSGRKKFETLFDAQGYIEDLMLSTENGYAVILDEDGNDIPGEGGAWC